MSTPKSSNGYSQQPSFSRHRRNQSYSNFGLNQFKDQLKRIKKDAVDDLSRKMDELIDNADFTTGTHVLLQTYRGSPGGRLLTSDRQKRIRRCGDGLPEKEYIMQNSVLTDLFQSRHIRTIENMVVACIIVWVLAMLVSDYYEKQSFMEALPRLDFFESAFLNYQLAIFYWLRFAVLAFLVYPVTNFWAKYRLQFDSEDSGQMMLSRSNYDRLFLLIFVVYQIYFLLLPFDVLFRNPILGSASALGLALEQLRLLMKTHAFVREVSKRILRNSSPDCLKKKNDAEISMADDGCEPMEDADEKMDKQLASSTVVTPDTTPGSPASNSTSRVKSRHSNDSIPGFPGFSRYLYFMFAPTLVYRDFYPRTEMVDWNYVFSNFLQFVGCLVYVYYILERFLFPEMANFSAHDLSFELVIKSTFRCIVPGTIVLVMGFFGFLHSWLNAWAEMLRFGDRLFYKDWWNCCSFAEYYRTWNCVVHDWLYSYIYKDMQELLSLKGKFLSTLSVFLVSAVFHEYVVIAMLRFFFPVLLVQFGLFGFMLTFVRSDGRWSNVFFWSLTIFGLGLLTSLYSMEVAARHLCPPVHGASILDMIVPRSLTCFKSNQ